MQHLACPPIAVATLGNLVPAKYIETLEQNQKIATCCRHPENHTIEAWYSCEANRDRGLPDIYIFTCTCGKKHRRLLGEAPVISAPPPVTDTRPFWEIR
jgi:hypothetical protein